MSQITSFPHKFKIVSIGENFPIATRILPFFNTPHFVIFYRSIFKLQVPHPSSPKLYHNSWSCEVHICSRIPPSIMMERNPNAHILQRAGQPTLHNWVVPCSPTHLAAVTTMLASKFPIQMNLSARQSSKL